MENYLRTLLTFLFVLVVAFTTAQPTYHTIAQDTIITIPRFPRNTYLLNGKKLTLPVMRWFMEDYQLANDQVELAVLTNQLSVSGYSIGSVFLLTGFFINDQNRQVSNDIIRLGAVGIGAGILFQILSQGYEKKATRYYNAEVRALYQRTNAAGFSPPAGTNVTLLRIRF